MIILRVLPGLLANGVVGIPELPCVDEVGGRKLFREKPEDYVSLVVYRQRALASAFHKHMAEGQTYHTSNSNRKTFCKDVTDMAKRVNFPSFVFVRMTVFSSLWKAANNNTTKMNLNTAGSLGKVKA